MGTGTTFEESFLLGSCAGMGRAFGAAVGLVREVFEVLVFDLGMDVVSAAASVHSGPLHLSHPVQYAEQPAVSPSWSSAPLDLLDCFEAGSARWSGVSGGYPSHAFSGSMYLIEVPNGLCEPHLRS